MPVDFVDVGEIVEAAAVRETREGTGLEVTLTGLLGVDSDPARDPRGLTVSIIYTGQAHGVPVAGDDAGAVRSVSPDDRPRPAFDHDEFAPTTDRGVAEHKGPSGR